MTIKASIVRETEKAILANVTILNIQLKKEIRRDIWFPKSQVQVSESGIECPAWLAAKKLEEVAAGRNLGMMLFV